MTMTIEQWTAETMRLADAMGGYYWLEGHAEGCGRFKDADGHADKRRAIRDALTAYLAAYPGRQEGEPSWWAAALNRRATVEQWMFDAANGKRPMPDASELRQWALKLGTPADGEPATPPPAPEGDARDAARLDIDSLIDDLEYAVLCRAKGLPDSAENLSEAKQAVRAALSGGGK